MSDKLRVGVMFGGQSGEHAVSLASAESIMQAIDRQKYEVIPIGITQTGEWLIREDAHQQLTRALAEPVDLPTSTSSVGEVGSDRLKRRFSTMNLPDVDVLFPVLHGTFGEDGTMQGLFELLDMPYVGCGVMASAVCMDKAICKDVFRAHGLPIVLHQTILRQAWQANPDQILTDCEAALPYPMFTKPANLGSSVGIRKVNNQAELRAGLDEAARYDRKLIVEQGLEAREIEVSVLGNDDPIASVPGEVIPSRAFYSYAAKYIDNRSDIIIPADLSPEYVEFVQKLAVMAFQALDCAGLARCDFLLEKGTGELFINELNTMPGFTAISMYPKLWAASGLTYPDLLDRLLTLAIERHQDKRQSLTVFDVATAE